MSSPPAGAPRPRRRILGFALVVGLAILAFGAVTALFGADVLNRTGYVAATPPPPPASVSTTDGSLVANPAPITTADDPKVPPAAAEVQVPAAPPQISVDISYPQTVMVGDALPIKIEIKSDTWLRLPGPIELQLLSGSLDLGDGSKRVIPDGAQLPAIANFTAGTKQTGVSSLIVRITAQDPLTIVTSAGSTDAGGIAVPSEDGAAIGGAKGPLSPTQHLELDAPLNIQVVTKYAIPDTMVHWLGIGGWIISAIGAGTIFTALNQLRRRRVAIVRTR